MNKLLIVDDSNVIRTKIENIYKDNDSVQVVGKATNGRMAVQLLGELAPNIVTMDLTMPRMDGIECIKKLIELNPKLKILVVSALSDKETGIRALTLGAQGFLCKPFTQDDLKSALQKIINV